MDGVWGLYISLYIIGDHPRTTPTPHMNELTPPHPSYQTNTKPKKKKKLQYMNAVRRKKTKMKKEKKGV